MNPTGSKRSKLKLLNVNDNVVHRSINATLTTKIVKEASIFLLLIATIALFVANI